VAEHKARAPRLHGTRGPTLACRRRPADVPVPRSTAQGVRCGMAVAHTAVAFGGRDALAQGVRGLRALAVTLASRWSLQGSVGAAASCAGICAGCTPCRPPCLCLSPCVHPTRRHIEAHTAQGCSGHTHRHSMREAGSSSGEATSLLYSQQSDPFAASWTAARAHRGGASTSYSAMANQEQRLREFLDKKDLAMLSGKPIVFPTNPKFGRYSCTCSMNQCLSEASMRGQEAGRSRGLEPASGRQLRAQPHMQPAVRSRSRVFGPSPVALCAAMAPVHPLQSSRASSRWAYRTAARQRRPLQKKCGAAKCVRGLLHTLRHHQLTLAAMRSAAHLRVLRLDAGDALLPGARPGQNHGPLARQRLLLPHQRERQERERPASPFRSLLAAIHPCQMRSRSGVWP
jgi:hypothetical protein